MLIRLSGGESGIKAYLEHGQKQGRAYSRDELDERLILAGDLQLTDAVINRMQNSGDKYLHITLAFKEDELLPETLSAITQDFKHFAFTAFNDDEYCYYAEAHLPKIKSYSHANTNERIERKPHIHIVIPKFNLLSGEALNPFGLVERQVKYLEAIQETLNNRYGLASPKDNRRDLFTNASEMLSRYKGDSFTGGHQAFKTTLLAELRARNITCYDDFKQLLTEYGEVKVRNAGKDTEYLWVKPSGEHNRQGINLRDAAFSRRVIETPDAQNRLAFANDARYERASSPKENPAHYEQALQDWHRQRAKEIKYVYLGKRREYDAYQQATAEEKAQLLNEREQGFYRTHMPKEVTHDYSRTDAIRDHLRAAADYLETASRHTSAVKTAVGNLTATRRDGIDQRHYRTDRTVSEAAARRATAQPAPGTKSNIIQQQLYDLQREREQAVSNREFAAIKQTLEAKRLLAWLSHSHGVNPAIYPISQGRDGGDRIQAGSRKLNVSDFLTKELNLDYRSASQILRDVYQEQNAQVVTVQPKQPPRVDLWRRYQAERQARAVSEKAERQVQQQHDKAEQTRQQQAIKSAYQHTVETLRTRQDLSYAERKAAMSVAKMQRIHAEAAVRKRRQYQREQLRAAQRDAYQNGYPNWLIQQAQDGDETALTELRRIQVKIKQGTGQQDFLAGSEAQQTQTGSAVLLKSFQLSYHVHRDGTVTYRRGHTDIMRDEGRTVTVLNNQDDALELSLRLAYAKFGKKLTVHGSSVFKANIARVAADIGLKVEFTDPNINALKIQREAELQREKAFTNATLFPTTQWLKDSVKPDAEQGHYQGHVVAVTARYVIQAQGQTLIRHDRRLFDEVPTVGNTLQIHYYAGQLKLTPIANNAVIRRR